MCERMRLQLHQRNAAIVISLFVPGNIARIFPPCIVGVVSACLPYFYAGIYILQKLLWWGKIENGDLEGGNY